MQEYRSATDEFKINFPSYPEVIKGNTLESADGYSVPYNIYVTGNDVVAHSVLVADYRAVAEYQAILPWLFDADSNLKALVEGMAQKEKGGSIMYSNLETINGYQGISAKLSIPQDGTTYTMIVKGMWSYGRLYGVATVGTGQEEFDAFFKSFVIN